METLNFEQMEQVNGGLSFEQGACGTAMGIVTGVWSMGFGIINPFLGFGVGMAFTALSTWVCSNV